MRRTGFKVILRKDFVMSRYASKPKTFFLSFRVNKLERELLQEASEKTGRDVSTLLRQSLKTVIKEVQAD